MKRTWIVFLISVAIAVPLVILANTQVNNSLVSSLVTMVTGWTAGGFIVGTYIDYKNKRKTEPRVDPL